jgi:thioredoxin reductase (NADPH)
MCQDEPVVIVGGGNSAGQAAIFLSSFATKVYLLVRGPNLKANMSKYLISRIEASPTIILKTRTTVVALDGGDRLEGVRWIDHLTGESQDHEVRRLFMMAGADPNTGWVSGCLSLDAKGFIKTGTSVLADWNLQRAPYPLETNVPGVFAVGDVRAESVKRVASAVGEGSMCIQFVHRALANQ